MIPAAQLVQLVGVKVEVPSRRHLPNTVKHELRQELDRIRAAVAGIERQLAEGDEDAPLSSLVDDAIVDQKCVPAPRDLFLRLARNGAFPSRKVGKRILAQWGDVRRALLGPGVNKNAAAALMPSENDELDGLRRRMGFATKADK